MRQNPYLSSRNTDTLPHFHSFCSGLAKLLWWFECDRRWRLKNSPCPEAVVAIGQKNMMMAYIYDEFIATIAKGRNSDRTKKYKQVTELQCFRSGFPHRQNEDTGEIISEISSRFRWFILSFKVKLHCFVLKLLINPFFQLFELPSVLIISCLQTGGQWNASLLYHFI